MPLQVLQNKITGLYFNGVSFAEKLIEDASVQKNFNPVVVRHSWGENAVIVNLCAEPVFSALTPDLVTALVKLNIAVRAEVLNCCDEKEIEDSYALCSAASDSADKLLSTLKA